MPDNMLGTYHRFPSVFIWWGEEERRKNLRKNKEVCTNLLPLPMMNAAACFPTVWIYFARIHYFIICRTNLSYQKTLGDEQVLPV